MGMVRDGYGECDRLMGILWRLLTTREIQWKRCKHGVNATIATIVW